MNQASNNKKRSSSTNVGSSNAKISRFFRPSTAVKKASVAASAAGADEKSKDPNPNTDISSSISSIIENDGIIDLMQSDNQDHKEKPDNSNNNNPVCDDIDTPTALEEEDIPTDDLVNATTTPNQNPAFDTHQATKDGNVIEIATSHQPPETASSNPFQQFAFLGSSSAPVFSSSGTDTNANASLHYSSVLHLNRKSLGKKKMLDTTTTISKKKSTCKAGKKTSSEWIRMKDIPEQEQRRIVQKWISMADPSEELEIKRFQVLVAARLHARCQEGPVRKAMKELRSFFDNDNNNSNAEGFSVHAMAATDPDELHSCVKNLQYYITKSNNLVKAAQELKTRFGSQVPEDEHSLKQITGIGPVLADLLSFVNTRAQHQQIEREQKEGGL